MIRREIQESEGDSRRNYPIPSLLFRAGGAAVWCETEAPFFSFRLRIDLNLSGEKS